MSITYGIWSYMGWQELSEIQKSTLLALAHACNWSLSAHVPVEAITRGVQSNLRGDAKKALQQLQRKGYCYQHPTRGSMTWSLTVEGLKVAKMFVNKS